MTYEMLTGRPPFVGSMEQLMYQHFSTPPPAPSTFNPALPTAINPVLVRALAKKPEDRFPSIAAFADALQDAVHGSPAEASHEPQVAGIDTYTTLAISKQEADERPTPTPTLGVTPTPTPSNGMYIPGPYNGSMLNETTQQTTTITVFLVQTKGSGALTGSVTYTSAPQGVYPLTGTVDMQGNFSFSIQQPSSQMPLLYYGTVQQQGGNFLKGNFCNSTTSTCLSNLGYFNAGPGY